MLRGMELGAGQAETLCCLTVQSLLHVDIAKELVTNARTLRILVHTMATAADFELTRRVAAALCGLAAEEETAARLVNLDGLDDSVLALLIRLVQCGNEEVMWTAAAGITLLSRTREICEYVARIGCQAIIALAPLKTFS